MAFAGCLACNADECLVCLPGFSLLTVDTPSPVAYAGQCVDCTLVSVENCAVCMIDQNFVTPSPAVWPCLRCAPGYGLSSLDNNCVQCKQKNCGQCTLLDSGNTRCDECIPSFNMTDAGDCAQLGQPGSAGRLTFAALVLAALLALFA